MTRTRPGGSPRCARTAGSSVRSVAMTQSAARAHASTAWRSGRYAARFSLARDGSVAPNSSSPCGLRTSGAAACARLPRVAEDARAKTVDEVDLALVHAARRPAGRRVGRTTDRRCFDRAPSFRGGRQTERCDTAHSRSATPGWIDAACAPGVAGGRVMSVTRTPASARCRTRSWTLPFEAAEAVQREDGARDDRDASGGVIGACLHNRCRALDAGDNCRSVEPLLGVLPCGRAEPGAQVPHRPQPPHVVGQGRRCRGQQAGALVDDDVGGAAGVHRGNRHAEGACFDQHAAQRLGAARGKDQHRGMGHPCGGRGLIDPAERSGCCVLSAPLPPRSPRAPARPGDHQRPVECRLFDRSGTR